MFIFITIYHNDDTIVTRHRMLRISQFEFLFQRLLECVDQEKVVVKKQRN